MSFEPHYVNNYIVLGLLVTILSMIFRSMFVLFMDSLEKDEYLINEFYYRPPRRMKRSKSF